MASEKAKELAAKQKAQIKAEKLRKKNSTDPRDWGRWRQFVEAYKRTAEVDPSVTWWMLGGAAGVIVVVTAIGLLSRAAWWAWVPLAILGAILVAMLILVQKTKSGMIKRYKGQPGAAEVVLQLLNNKKYTYTMGIAANRDLDLVHRVIGPCGIVLIGEGQAGRTRALLQGEARRHEQVAYGVPVTQVMMGDAANQVSLDKLQKHIEKLPKAVQPHQIVEVKQRLKALDARPRTPLPKGPLPTPKGVKRALRGR